MENIQTKKKKNSKLVLYCKNYMNVQNYKQNVILKFGSAKGLNMLICSQAIIAIA